MSFFLHIFFCFLIANQMLFANMFVVAINIERIIHCRYITQIMYMFSLYIICVLIEFQGFCVVAFQPGGCQSARNQSDRFKYALYLYSVRTLHSRDATNDINSPFTLGINQSIVHMRKNTLIHRASYNCLDLP